MATTEQQGRRTRQAIPAGSPTAFAEHSRRHARMGPKGQILVPVSLRRELDLRPGQKVRLEVENGKLVVTPIPADLIERLHGCLADSGDLLGDLMRDHREEIERDEAYLASLSPTVTQARTTPPVARNRSQDEEALDR